MPSPAETKCYSFPYFLVFCWFTVVVLLILQLEVLEMFLVCFTVPDPTFLLQETG